MDADTDPIHNALLAIHILKNYKKNRTLLISRNSCIVLLLLLNSIVFSQGVLESKNINLQLNNASLIDVIKAIETQSGISFVYNTTVMRNAQKMSVDVNEVDLNILLQTICNKSGNSYKVINNQVVFFKVAAQTTKPIKILIKQNKKIQQEQSTQKPFSKSTFQIANNISNSNIVFDTTNRNIDLIKDTIPPLIRKTNSIWNCELIPSISPKITNKISIIDTSTLVTGNNFSKQNISISIAPTNKFFYSLQINSLLNISPGFKSGDSLSSDKTRILKKSISSYGLRSSINLGYTIKHLSFKSGLVYTQFNEELTEKIIYNQFLKQTDWQVITWQEYSSDGIEIHTDTIPITRTIVKDSVVTSVNKYTYRYIGIPFNIDYTLTLNPKWSVFSSIGFTYAITLKNNFSSLSSIYKPNEVNKLDISAELNIGLKFCSNRLQYYFMTGGMVRSTWAPKNNLIKRNPVYLNFGIGIINYF